jgi:hypothetical protein
VRKTPARARLCSDCSAPLAGHAATAPSTSARSSPCFQRLARWRNASWQKVVRGIQRRRARGDSLRAIAESLNRDGVPTAQGVCSGTRRPCEASWRGPPRGERVQVGKGLPLGLGDCAGARCPERRTGATRSLSRARARDARPVATPSRRKVLGPGGKQPSGETPSGPRVAGRRSDSTFHPSRRWRQGIAWPGARKPIQTEWASSPVAEVGTWQPDWRLPSDEDDGRCGGLDRTPSLS